MTAALILVVLSLFASGRQPGPLPYEQQVPASRTIPFEGASVAEMKAREVVVSTDLGDFVIELFPEEAPEHVRQFLRFAALGLYDGTTIYRVIPGFVVQGGDIRRKKPAVSAADRKLLVNLQPEFNDIKHVRGTVSMARSAALDSAADSFFMVLDDQSHLDGRYSAFGRVTRGMDVLDALSMVPTAGETPVRRLEITVRVRPIKSY